MHKNKCDLGYHAQTEWPVIRLLVGAKAWDMFMSLAATTKQLGLAFTSTSMPIFVSFQNSRT